MTDKDYSVFAETTPEGMMDYAWAVVRSERMSQERKWGEQNHNFDRWLAILQEEIGETSQEWLTAHYGGQVPEFREEFFEELVQVAAVAMAMVQNAMERRESRKPLGAESHDPD